MKTGLITGNFLNIHNFCDPTKNQLFTTILRKKHSRNNVIPPDSNMIDCFKHCAVRHTLGWQILIAPQNLKKTRQKGVIKLILELKGYSAAKIRKMKKKHTINNKKRKNASLWEQLLLTD